MNRIKKNKVKLGAGILVLFHLIGLVGILSPYRKSFVELTPVNLLVSAFTLFLFQKLWQPKVLWLIAIAFAVGFMAEVIGVNTGLIFGNYTYGSTLGPKVLGVPLIIGLNWALLVYCTFKLSEFVVHPVLKSLAGAGFLLAFDALLEPVAMELGFWQWEQDTIPFSNYAGWFATGFIIHLAANMLLPTVANKMARPLYFIQMGFFLALNFML